MENEAFVDSMGRKPLSTVKEPDPSDFCSPPSSPVSSSLLYPLHSRDISSQPKVDLPRDSGGDGDDRDVVRFQEKPWSAGKPYPEMPRTRRMDEKPKVQSSSDQKAIAGKTAETIKDEARPSFQAPLFPPGRLLNLLPVLERNIHWDRRFCGVGVSSHHGWRMDIDVKVLKGYSEGICSAVEKRSSLVICRSRGKTERGG